MPSILLRQVHKQIIRVRQQASQSSHSRLEHQIAGIYIRLESNLDRSHKRQRGHDRNRGHSRRGSDVLAARIPEFDPKGVPIRDGRYQHDGDRFVHLRGGRGVLREEVSGKILQQHQTRGAGPRFSGRKINQVVGVGRPG